MFRTRAASDEDLKDLDLMPFGVHKDKFMEDVPVDYLIYLYEEKICKGNLKRYIKNKLKGLKKEVKNKNNAHT